MAIELSEIDFENIGVWPASTKIAVCLIAAALMFGAGYWFDIRSQVQKLREIKSQQVSLEAEIEKQQSQVLSIKALQSQIKDIENYLTNTLGQMQNSTEIPKILEDISLQGTKSGLEFRSIQPVTEIKSDFYADTPINIIVVGSYHQLGKFIADLSALPRYVVITDFSLKKADTDNNAATSSQTIANANNSDPKEKLEMSLQAHIYRSIPLEDAQSDLNGGDKPPQTNSSAAK